MFKMLISHDVFFNFKILIFWVVSGLKRQKMTQNNKKFCLLRLVFQEPYIIWSSFLMHMYVQKNSIFWHSFLFFSKFWFWGSLGGWGMVKGEKWPKKAKNYVCLTLYLRNCTSYDCDLWSIFVKWRYLKQIFSFFKIFIFGVFGGVKGQKMT